MEVNIGPISELYSPPRISAAAEEKGLKASTCYDLLTGWDLSQEPDHKQMWKVLREERPKVIAVCPPWGPFSQMQAINKGRIDPVKAMRVLYAGQEHLRLAVAGCIWQLNQGNIGRSILFEHPAWATSWQEPELQSQVKQVISHMRQFGMNVDGQGLNRKSTRWVTDMMPVAKRLDRQCDGQHSHVVLEGDKRTMKAQIYPPRLCTEIVKGIQEHLREKHPSQAFPVEVFAEGEDIDEEAVEEEENSGEAEDSYTVSEEEKKMALKIHKAVGHSQKPEFIRFLRAARVKRGNHQMGVQGVQV